MANPLKYTKLEYEADSAAVALAGIRPILQDSVSVAPTSEQTYTITDIRAKRAVVLHLASGQTDIRLELNAAATAAKVPVIPGVYFVLEVEKDDVIHLYNTSGSAVTVYIVEIR